MALLFKSIIFILLRYLNEQLYTQTSAESVKMFKEDVTLFSAYHQVVPYKQLNNVFFKNEDRLWTCLSLAHESLTERCNRLSVESLYQFINSTLYLFKTWTPGDSLYPSVRSIFLNSLFRIFFWYLILDYMSLFFESYLFKQRGTKNVLQ